MFRLFRWSIYASVILLVLIVAALFSIDPVVKNLLETHIRSRTGMDVKIGRVSVGLFSPTLTLQQVKLYNTAEFGGSPFLDLPELYLEYDRAALQSQKLHLRLVRAEVAEFNVVENREGRNNLQVLSPSARNPGVRHPVPAPPAPKPGAKPVSSQPAAPQPSTSQPTSSPPPVSSRTPTPVSVPAPTPIPAPTPAPPASGSGDLVFAGIDTLNLTLYKGSFTSLRRPAANREVVFAIRNEVYHNVNTRHNLESVLIAVALKGGANFLLETIARGNAPAVAPNPAPMRRQPVPPGR